MPPRRLRRTHITYHPNAPKALLRDHARLKSLRAIGREKNVNPRYVHDLMVRGVVPTNRTIAAKLHCKLPSLRSINEGDKRRRHQRWWRALTITQRNELILILYHYREKGLPHRDAGSLPKTGSLAAGCNAGAGT